MLISHKLKKERQREIRQAKGGENDFVKGETELMGLKPGMQKPPEDEIYKGQSLPSHSGD